PAACRAARRSRPRRGDAGGGAPPRAGAREAPALRLRDARDAGRGRAGGRHSPSGSAPGRARRAPGRRHAGELAARLCRAGTAPACHAPRHGRHRGCARAPGRQAAPARGARVAAVRPAPRASRAGRVGPTVRAAAGATRAPEGTGMMLYVVRHAIAEDAPAGGDDAARKLTPVGRRKMRAAAAGLRALRVAPAVVLASPLARALETARIVV